MRECFAISTALVMASPLPFGRSRGFRAPNRALPQKGAGIAVEEIENFVRQVAARALVSAKCQRCSSCFARLHQASRGAFQPSSGGTVGDQWGTAFV